MKINLKVVLIALIVILLTLISFVGIYTKKSNVYKNIIADYLLSRNLKGSRVIELAVDTSTKEVTYDKDGNIVEDTDEENKTEGEETEQRDESEYTTVNEPVNSEDLLTEENYKSVKKILEKRLDTLKVADYKVKLNSSNGNIVVEVPEDTKTDEVESYLDSIGSFEIVDEEDNTLLLDTNNIKNVQVAYNTDTTGTSVYLVISFDKEGTKKLEEISNEYTMITDEEGNTTEKKVTLKMEGEELFSTYFSDPIVNGEIQLTVGSASSDVKTIEQYLNNAAGVAMLLNSGKMPIKYTIKSDQFIKPVINDNLLSVGIYVLLGLVIISFIYLIYKYKKYGALTIIGSVAAIDLLLLVIRYTNVYLSIESAVGFIVLILINTYIINNILKEIKNDGSNKSIINGLLKSIDVIITILILSIVFTFISWSAINNVGILIFWGIICIAISHLIFTRTLLLNSNKE